MSRGTTTGVCVCALLGAVSLGASEALPPSVLLPTGMGFNPVVAALILVGIVLIAAGVLTPVLKVAQRKEFLQAHPKLRRYRTYLGIQKPEYDVTVILDMEPMPAYNPAMDLRSNMLYQAAIANTQMDLQKVGQRQRVSRSVYHMLGIKKEVKEKKGKKKKAEGEEVEEPISADFVEGAEVDSWDILEAASKVLNKLMLEMPPWPAPGDIPDIAHNATILKIEESTDKMGREYHREVYLTEKELLAELPQLPGPVKGLDGLPSFQTLVTPYAMVWETEIFCFQFANEYIPVIIASFDQKRALELATIFFNAEQASAIMFGVFNRVMSKFNVSYSRADDDLKSMQDSADDNAIKAQHEANRVEELETELKHEKKKNVAPPPPPAAMNTIRVKTAMLGMVVAGVSGVMGTLGVLSIMHLI